MDTNLLDALKAIDPSDCDYQTWINVGFALKEEGYPCSVWDDWSRNDSRYRVGECERKWRGFNGNANPVKGGTIIQMAKDRGWVPEHTGNPDYIMDYDDAIEIDEPMVDITGKDLEMSPVEQFRAYLQALFQPEDHVNYVVTSQCSDGRYRPIGRGASAYTQENLVDSLNRHPDDLGATIGDWDKRAGAWIRFNPVDGEGVGNDNITAFRYALVESDDMPIDEQIAEYRKHELPIAAMVHSGGKSVHAIVRVDAKDIGEYRERVNILYDYLEKQGMKIDRQNKNPSRLSRLPGAVRGDEVQKLICTNIGRSSWQTWLDYINYEASDELPQLESLADSIGDPPPLPEELIEGILRRGHKMLISGSSKAGKSFLLMELCICMAEGMAWLGFKCKQGRVLYVNLEIDRPSCINRFKEIYHATGLSNIHPENILIWNLRGRAQTLDKLVPLLVRRVQGQHIDAIIIDPIYKVIIGDENNASDMGAFCNEFDRICDATGCSTIYCHHHSKGDQGQKRAMDRASGSGVFARDPDAQLDMVELELVGQAKDYQDGHGTAWRLESSLREFKNIKPVNFWFNYPIHEVDTEGILDKCPAQGSMMSKTAERNNRNREDANLALEHAFQVLCVDNDTVTVRDVAAYLNISDKTARARARDCGFNVDNGVISRGQDGTRDNDGRIPPVSGEQRPADSGNASGDGVLGANEPNADRVGAKVEQPSTGA